MPVNRSALLPSALAALLAFPAIGATQSASEGPDRDRVPVGMFPPAGKCRIWMFGVPAAQQPAVTDCATALRQKPSNGIVLYGPAERDADRERFDPKVGRDPRDAKESERKNGSAAEMEIERRRAEADRARMLREMRERDERERQNSADRTRIMSGSESRRTVSPPSNAPGGQAQPRGTTAVPRASTANSSAPAGSSTPPAPTPKPPAEGSKKPE